MRYSPGKGTLLQEGRPVSEIQVHTGKEEIRMLRFHILLDLTAGSVFHLSVLFYTNKAKENKDGKLITRALCLNDWTFLEFPPSPSS